MARMTRERLKELISNALSEEEGSDYNEKFQQALEKWNVSSIGELSAEEKKDFFNYLDASYDAKNENTKFTKNDLKRMIREEYIKLNEGKNAIWRSSLLINERRGALDDTSNWHKFHKVFDMDWDEMDDFAYNMGYNSLKDMDMSITPAKLYKKNPNKFTKEIKNASMFASMKSNGQIKQFVDKSQPEF